MKSLRNKDLYAGLHIRGIIRYYIKCRSTRRYLSFIIIIDKGGRKTPSREKGRIRWGEKERERGGRIRHLKCMQLSRYSARCLCGGERFFPSGNITSCRRELKRGSAPAYCLKLLIGLRTDAACTVLQLYSLSLFFSFSLFPFCLLSPRFGLLFDLYFFLSLSNPTEYFPSRVSVASRSPRLSRYLLSVIADFSPEGRRVHRMLREVPMKPRRCNPRQIRGPLSSRTNLKWGRRLKTSKKSIFSFLRFS